MYAFLLILGAAVAGAGLALAAAGLSIQQHAFDTTNVTPSAIAIVGGCILVGLSFVVRALTRVERALLQRSAPDSALASETVEAAAATAVASETAAATAVASETAAATVPASETAPVSFPVNPKAAPHPSITVAEPAAHADATVGVPAPTAERVENVAPVEMSEASPSAKALARSQEETNAGKPAAGAHTNGAAQPKAAPQVAAAGRPARQSQDQAKNSMFDALWPKGRTAASEINTAPVVQPLPVEPVPQSVAASAPSARSVQQQSTSAAPAVSILKSGVVEGMAYTLYSDGSIEATLPSGTLRFSSITELRNHIEHNS